MTIERKMMKNKNNIYFKIYFICYNDNNFKMNLQILSSWKSQDLKNTYINIYRL